MKCINLFLFINILLKTLILTITPCKDFIKQDERTIINYLQQNLSNFSSKDYEECTDILMKTNHFTSLEFLLSEMTKKNLKVKEVLDEKILNYNNYLNSLKDKFQYKESEFKKVSPFLRWAQSREYILLDIKFTEDLKIPGIKSKF